MAKFATNASGAMLLLHLIQVTESISGSVVPLAMFFFWGGEGSRVTFKASSIVDFHSLCRSLSRRVRAKNYKNFK